MPTSEQTYLPNEIGQTAGKPLLVLDTRLYVKAASKSFYSAFQATPSEIIGKNLTALANGQWNNPVLLTLLNELPDADGEFDDFVMQHDFPGSGPSMKVVGARRLPPLDGSQSGMILLSIQDATAQKRIEGEADKSLAHFRTTLASVGDAVIVTDLESRITFMNPAAERLTGWRKKHALNRLLPDIFQIVDEQSVKMDNPALKAIQAGQAVSLPGHATLIARDGSQWPVDDSAAPILDAAGRITGVVMIFRDITDRRKLEQELQSSEVRYRRLFEAAHDGILILDASTARVVDVNPFMGDLLGYPREYFLGKELWEISVFKDAEASKAAMETLQKTGQIRYDDHPLQHRDGRHIPVEFVSNVYQEGTRDVIQCNIRDITERKQHADELAEARKNAEAASRSKSEFLANMSHEIRTPMSAILGFADMLQQKSPEECAQVGCVQIIRRNAAHLLELINDILDISKVEAGQMKVERISCDLLVLLSEINALVRPRAEEKGLGFEVSFQGSIPRLIQTDPARLRQILINLIGNAMKFTESGRVDLRVMEERSSSPNIVLRVDVIDSGIGMTPEQLDRLFRPFTQGDESITRKYGGTGLGLTISGQLAKLLGGDVTVISQPRLGSTFTIRVDGGPSAGIERLQGLTEAALSTSLDRSAKNEIYLRGRILLVEDGADNQRLLRMQLSSAGGSVVSALDGKEAVEVATSQPFDLILMDMQMPIMDGYAATIELRRRGLTIPIIALTAYAMAEDRDKCMAAGCSAYLSKPIDEETLLTTVNHHLGNDRAPVPAGEKIKSTLAGDPRMMEIIPGFVDRLPGKVRKMLDLLEHHDLVALQQVVHEILGTAGGYGFAPISPPARRAQQSLQEGEEMEPITAEITSLIEVIRRIDGYDESKAPGTAK
jgi:PAS domain S-box-containing protein